jgi:hypothetical protein
MLKKTIPKEWNNIMIDYSHFFLSCKYVEIFGIK